MKIVVDLSLCNLHGLCVETAPEVFEIGATVLHVLNETLQRLFAHEVDKAARECPTGTISIEG